MGRALILALAAAAAVRAQGAPDDLIARVRAKLIETIARQESYSCTQTVERVLYESVRGRALSTSFDAAVAGGGRPGSSAGAYSVPAERDCDAFEKKLLDRSSSSQRLSTDRLRIDVAISGGEEIYSFPGENQFEPQRLAEIANRDLSSRGSFGGYLARIFGAHAAGLTSRGEVTENGRRLLQFGFGLERDEASAYSGTLLIDPQSLDLVRVMVRVPSFPDIHACAATASIDWTRQDVAGSSALLPARALLRIPSRNGGGRESRIEYSACRMFSPGSVHANAEQQLPLFGATHTSAGSVSLPRDLPFRVVTEEDVDSSTAAAGDAIRARTITPIHEKSGAVLVPEGAAVTARILQIQYLARTKTVDLVMRLDAIEINGKSQPLFAHAVEKPFRGGVFLHFPGKNASYVVKKGVKTSWVTDNF